MKGLSRRKVEGESIDKMKMEYFMFTVKIDKDCSSFMWKDPSFSGKHRL